MVILNNLYVQKSKEWLTITHQTFYDLRFYEGILHLKSLLHNSKKKVSVLVFSVGSSVFSNKASYNSKEDLEPNNKIKPPLAIVLATI